MQVKGNEATYSVEDLRAAGFDVDQYAIPVIVHAIQAKYRNDAAEARESGGYGITVNVVAGEGSIILQYIDHALTETEEMLIKSFILPAAIVMLSKQTAEQSIL